MTQFSYSSTGIAIAPPNWLQRDLAHANAYLPGLKLMVLFHDDLPFMNRARSKSPIDPRFDRLGEFIAAHWSSNPFSDQQLIDLSGDDVARAETSAKKRHEYLPNDLTGEKDLYTTTLKPAQDAIITLPPRQYTPVQITAKFLGLPEKLCAAPAGANPHRAIFWHEHAHVRQGARKLHTGNRRSDEREADLGSIRDCELVNDLPTATYLKDLRLLDTFFDVGMAKSSDYWNSLSLARIEHDDRAELSSLLELKLRTANPVFKPPTNTRSFIQSAFHTEEYVPLQLRFNTFGAIEKIQQLRSLAKFGPSYRFAHTAALEQLTLKAAQRLVPGAFA